jgi:YidC/Oxa1 family membrane protein insertase
MQGMDKNTVLGFVLMGLLLFGYLYITNKNNQQFEALKKHQEDSIASVVALQKPIVQKDTVAALPIVDTSAAGKILHGQEQLLTVENEVLKITFSNKGGQPTSVLLKKHKSLDSSLVRLVNGATDKISYNINMATNQATAIADIYFSAGSIVKNADSSQYITYKVSLPNGGTVTHTYTLLPSNYLINFSIQLDKTTQLLTQNNFNLQWAVTPIQHEKDVAYERQQTQLVFLEEDGYDYHTLFNKKEKQFDKPVQWLSIKQQFFNSTLIAKNKFDGGKLQWANYAKDDSLHQHTITEATASFHTKLPNADYATLPFQLYYGPNDYNILRNNGVDNMDKIVNLGQGIYTFARPINQFIILPVFNGIKRFVSSFGIVIALLTIFIRLVTSPLMYPGYLTSAKMKILRPELDELKKKFPDQQQYAMEQMKFMREAGVNTFAGCLPSLLQIPIFFALFSFFNANVALRGESFLWSKNLAAYDSIYNFGVNIPFYGSHISLFTLLAVATSFLISIYQMNASPDSGNPALKYMPYIFPFLMLGFFNNMPSALTWYYTVSNAITLLLQWAIKTFIIDHEKVMAKIQENRKKPKTQSKWQERLSQIQEQQKKMQEQKKRGS